MTETGHDVIDRILQSFGLTDKFPKACQRQVQDMLAKDPTTTNNSDEDQKLVDLSHLPYITIDNDRSMDLDQAMYICRTQCPPLLPLPPLQGGGGGGDAAKDRMAAFRYPDDFDSEDKRTQDTQSSKSPPTVDDSILVSYALADGAYFVPAFSPLFEHALRRGGASFYLPGNKSIPMLPRELSENIMSLNPHVKRRALVFDTYLDPLDGTVQRTLYRYAIIVSQWKGTYREVSEYYDAVDKKNRHGGGGDGDSKDEKAVVDSWLAHQPFTETLDLLREVGQKRIELAKQRNVVQYNRNNDDGGGAITVDPDTGMLTFTSTLLANTPSGDDKSHHEKQPKKGRYSSEAYNEQVSLLCNTEGAKILAYLDDLEEKTGSPDILHPIYRTQSGPRADQTRTLEEVIANTLQVHGLDVAEWGWHDQEEVLASYLDRIRSHASSINGDTQPNLKQKWIRVVTVIDRQAQITNQAASFSSSPEDGHHALKMTHYARFSSPMRELVGCFTHKELYEAHIGGFSHKELSPEKDMERKSVSVTTVLRCEMRCDTVPAFLTFCFLSKNVNTVRDNVIRAARRAKEIQKCLSSMVFLHMLNTLFYSDLRLRLNQRKMYQGVVMGMDFSDRQKSRRVYVQLDEPHIQIKVYGEDLDYHYNCRYGPEGGSTYNDRGSTVSIVPMEGSFRHDVDDRTLPPNFHAGDPVSIRVGDYAQFYGQKSRSRWVFLMIPETVEQDEVTRRRSLVRNSVIDLDLLLAKSDLDEESALSSFSEHTSESFHDDDESGDDIGNDYQGGI